MKYNAKYNRWFTKDGLVYRYDKKSDKLISCRTPVSAKGYNRAFDNNGKEFRLCRAIWETFKGEIPEGYEIDHINTIRTDDRLENLRCVTHVENMRNPLTVISHTEANRKHRALARGKRAKVKTEFGEKFYAHYGLHFIDDKKLYQRELMYNYRHSKCRWEV